MFWQQVRETTRRATVDGALQPISTQTHSLDDHGLHFLVRVADQLAAKERVGKMPGSRRSNPFLPYDPALFVTDVGPSHVCLLNKYNVVPNHVLVVTKEFERQDAALTARDFLAWTTCLAADNSLGFFNSGPAAGASQMHKHLQVVPLPLPGCDSASPFPLSALIEEGLRTGNGIAPGLPFAHRLSALPAADPVTWARELEVVFQHLKQETTSADSTASDFNLLVARGWALFVPRRAECDGSISINGLGFSGAFFVRNSRDFDELRRKGPCSVLRNVSGESV